jgi:hypothetical protein
MRQGVARDAAPETHVIQLGLLGAQAGFDIAKTFAVRELSKGQTQELIPTREIFDVAIALIAIDANLKLVGREKIHKLREHGSAKIHRLPPEQAGKQYDATEKEAIY